MATPIGNSALANLSMPVANTRIAGQQKAARDLQLQQAVGQMKPAQATTQQAQQLGTAQATMAGSQAADRLNKQIAQTAQVASTGLQGQAIANQQQLGEQKLGLGQQQLTLDKQLAGISEDTKQKLYDERRQFAQDEAGRAFTNQRQLADLAIVKAKNADQLADYQQAANQASARNSEINQALFDKLAQGLQAQSQAINQIKDQLNSRNITEQQRQVAQQTLQQRLDEQYRMQVAQSALKQKIQADRAKAASDAMVWQSAGTIAGTVGGAVLGGPAGAAVGGALGGGLGTLAGTL